MQRRWLWALYARVYDTINANRPYVEMLDELVRSLHIDGKAPLSILDAGCGTGNAERPVADAHSDVTILGIDNSPEMLERAKVKFRQDPRVRFRRVDLDRRLPFGDGAFDRVISVNALYALRDPAFTLRELHRVLKRDGMLVFANPHERSSFMGIMRGQYRSLGTWRFLVAFVRNLPALVVIIAVNALFLRRDPNYWDMKSTQGVLDHLGFRNIALRYTYAGQDILASAIK